MPLGKVGVHFIKAGGFGLRLTAGSTGQAADDRRYTTVKSSSGSGGC